MNNIIRAVFNPGDDTTKAYGLHQWNYGQKLAIHGLDLPRAVEVHFAAVGDTEAIVRIGTTVDKVTTVPIPDVFFEQEMDIKAYVYLSDSQSGETIKTINMPMTPRQKPEGWNGNEETTMGAIMDAINQFADGKADGMDYKDNILKLMSGEKELARVTIAGGIGGTAREIELQKSDTAIQWRYTGEEDWRDLVLLEELKPTGDQIGEAIGKYLDENPVQPGATKEQAEQIEKNTEDIGELKGDLERLKQSGTGTGTGLSTEAIDKLEEVGNCLAYATADGGSKWTELISILRNGSSGGSGDGETTQKTLSSISATYTGGDVTVGTALTDLTGITVTAMYSDGSTANVTGYTLSGEILDGENTIIVLYGGLTSTFTVTGVTESSDDTSYLHFSLSDFTQGYSPMNEYDESDPLYPKTYGFLWKHDYQQLENKKLTYVSTRSSDQNIKIQSFYVSDDTKCKSSNSTIKANTTGEINITGAVPLGSLATTPIYLAFEVYLMDNTPDGIEFAFS